MAPPHNEQMMLNGPGMLLNHDLASPERRPRMASNTPERDRERLIEVLERELAAARSTEQRLLHIIEQAHEVLKHFGREGQAGQALGTALPPAPPHEAIPLSMRQRIRLLLQAHPGGLHRRQIEEQVGGKPLSNTLGGMKQAGLVVHKGNGIFALPPLSETPDK